MVRNILFLFLYFVLTALNYSEIHQHNFEEYLAQKVYEKTNIELEAIFIEPVLMKNLTQKTTFYTLFIYGQHGQFNINLSVLEIENNSIETKNLNNIINQISILQQSGTSNEKKKQIQKKGFEQTNVLFASESSDFLPGLNFLISEYSSLFLKIPWYWEKTSQTKLFSDIKSGYEHKNHAYYAGLDVLSFAHSLYSNYFQLTLYGSALNTEIQFRNLEQRKIFKETYALAGSIFSFQFNWFTVFTKFQSSAFQISTLSQFQNLNYITSGKAGCIFMDTVSLFAESNISKMLVQNTFIIDSVSLAWQFDYSATLMFTYNIHPHAENYISVGIQNQW